MSTRINVFLLSAVFGIFMCSPVCFASQSSTVETPLFSLTIPDEISDASVIEIEGNRVSFYLEQINSDFEGFVASVCAYRSVSEYAEIPHYERVGVIKDKNETSFDIVITYPTSINFDFTDTDITEKYVMIRDTISEIATSVTPGKNCTYTVQREVDNSDIYAPVLLRLQELVASLASPELLSQEGFSTLYQYHYNMAENPADLIGYSFIDINQDGYDELLIGSMIHMNKIVYDLYTVVDGSIHHVFSSANQDNYYLEEDGEGLEIKEMGSEGAGEAFIEYSILTADNSELTKEVKIIQSRSLDLHNPYFISYHGEDKLNPISKEVWESYQARQKDAIHPDYLPLSRF